MTFAADTLRDRVAIVTGASQGIGRSIAVELAKVGADVVVCSRRPAALKTVADDVRAARRRALAVECDVTEARQVDDVVAQTLGAFGRIDLLVDNAGYRIRSLLEDLPRAEWDAMIGTNLTGVFLFAQAVGRGMIRQKSGKIVNVTSVAGRTGVRGMAAYAAPKAGAHAEPGRGVGEVRDHRQRGGAGTGGDGRRAAGVEDAGHDRPGGAPGAADRRNALRQRRAPRGQPRGSAETDDSP